MQNCLTLTAVAAFKTPCTDSGYKQPTLPKSIALRNCNSLVQCFQLRLQYLTHCFSRRCCEKELLPFQQVGARGTKRRNRMQKHQGSYCCLLCGSLTLVPFVGLEEIWIFGYSEEIRPSSASIAETYMDVLLQCQTKYFIGF